jgi:hypothetical protein
LGTAWSMMVDGSIFADGGMLDSKLSDWLFCRLSKIAHGVVVIPIHQHRFHAKFATSNQSVTFIFWFRRGLQPSSILEDRHRIPRNGSGKLFAYLLGMITLSLMFPPKL